MSEHDEKGDEMHEKVMIPVSPLRRWWNRKTAGQSSAEGRWQRHFLLRVGVRMSLLERLLLLCGRTLVIEVRTAQQPAYDEALGDVESFAWTEPGS